MYEFINKDRESLTTKQDEGSFYLENGELIKC